MLHTLVDKVFLITTINSERFDYIASHLKENDIEYQTIVAPNYKIITDEIKVLHSGIDVRPALSLLSTYQSIIEISRLCKYKRITIIEDDCFFVSNWKELFVNFYNNIPTNWDVLNIGYHPIHDVDTIKESYNEYAYIPKNWHHTTHCMMLNNNIYEEFLDLYSRWNYTIPIDYTFNEIYKNSKFKSFCPVNKIVYQLSIRDQSYPIENIDIRFKSFLSN